MVSGREPASEATKILEYSNHGDCQSLVHRVKGSTRVSIEALGKLVSNGGRTLRKVGLA